MIIKFTKFVLWNQNIFIYLYTHIKPDYHKETKLNKKWDSVFKSKNGLVL